MTRPLFAAAALLLMLGAPRGVAAQVKIGYVNSQAILPETPGAQQAQEQFDQEMESYRSEVQQMATELENLVRQYEQQQAMLSPSAKQQRETDIRTKQQAYQERLATIDEQAAQRQQELVQPVMDRINQTIEEVRAEGSYSLILDVAAGGVVAADPALDLTQEVIQRLQAAADAAR